MKNDCGIVLFRRLTREEVLSTAEAFAKSKHWPWEGPVLVRLGLFTARVMTNTDYKGGNVHVWISLQTGEVKRAQFIHR